VQANFHNAAFRLAVLRIDSCTASKDAVGGDVAREGSRENQGRAKLAVAVVLLAPIAPLYPSLTPATYIFALARHFPQQI
jgi:hypothetical protein